MGWQALTRLDLTALGQLALVAASLCYALTALLGRVALRDVAPQVTAAGMMTGASLVMLPIALAIDGLPSPEHSPRVWAALAYSAVFATAIAYLLYYRLLGLSGAAYAGLITFLVAPVAIVLGAILLRETLPLRAYLGFATLVLGLVVLDGRLWRLLVKPKTPGLCTAMIYPSASAWRDAPQKQVLLFGMSGLGKTHVSQTLRDAGRWFHYSID